MLGEWIGVPGDLLLHPASWELSAGLRPGLGSPGREVRAKEASRSYPSGPTAWAGEPNLQGRGGKGNSRGDSARLQREFQRLSSNLELQLGYFGGGGGAGPQRSSGVRRAPGGAPGRSPAPPTCRDPGRGDESEQGEVRAVRAQPQPQRPRGFPLTCPQLPGLLTIYLAPSPTRRAANLQNRAARELPAGLAVV